jgi:VIT1/CCC1 family predicted Fe2+/Mn2+ transporter
MAAVAYTSTLADADYYESEREREYRHIQEVPNLEKEEIRAIYRAKGFADDLLERIVDTITASPDVWVAVMMSEELQLQPVDRRTALRSAIIVGIAAIIGSLIPLVPFIFLPVSTSIILSITISAVVLFIVGAIKARMTVGHPGKSGLEMAVIGTLSALIGYAVGALLRVPSTP